MSTDRNHTHLSRRERQIMDALYACEEASAADVQEHIPNPPSYSAVRALLGKLVDKGHVAFRRDGSRYVYRATLEKSAAQRNAWRRLRDTFFAGSTADAVVSLLGREGEHLSESELAAIEAKLADLKARRGPVRLMDAALDLRAVVLLVVASAAFTALSPAVYRRDPARRRLYLAALAAVLLLVPWWSFAGLWTWPLGVENPGRWLAQPVPWLLVWLWWTVGATLMLHTLLRVAAGRRLLNALPPFTVCAIDAQLRNVAAALNLKTPVAVHLGPSPCASTLGRARLVLPAAAQHWSHSARLAVLSHELAHVKRRDDRLLLLLRLLVDWYWWMPWLSRLHRRFVEAMEESCDDAASRAVGDRATYVDGLVQAARSLQGAPAAATHWPAAVSLLGHSHLTVRAERMLTPPPPSLDHADGRWALLWASLTLVILLTARPSAIPDHLPATAELFPLQPLPRAEAATAPPGPRVDTHSYLQQPAGGWLALPRSALAPRPVYPARALAQGIEGSVTVDVLLSVGPSGWLRRGPPEIVSSDPSGLLATAVARAYARAGAADVDAGLRALPVHNKVIDAPPPGTRLRLRRTYRFALATPADPAHGNPTYTGGSNP